MASTTTAQQPIDTDRARRFVRELTGDETPKAHQVAGLFARAVADQIDGQLRAESDALLAEVPPAQRIALEAAISRALYAGIEWGARFGFALRVVPDSEIGRSLTAATEAAGALA